MVGRIWHLLKSTWAGYSADNCVSRGASIAYYTVFSLAPVLVIVIAIAGLVFGADAARGAIVGQLGGMMGQQGAQAIQAMIAGAANHRSGVLATAIGVVSLLLTASGVFSEMQAALNNVWHAKPQHGTLTELVRVRLLGLGLVMALGFLLLVSLVVSAVIAAIGVWFADVLPGWQVLMRAVSFAGSLALIAVMFAAIYKVLPDADIGWRDVAVGALATALLFQLGKFLIGFYIGHSATASTFGAASTLAVVLLWIYYSSQIFLFGAEFTRAYAETHGSRVGSLPAPSAEPAASAPTGHAELESLKATLRSVDHRP